MSKYQPIKVKYTGSLFPEKTGQMVTFKDLAEMSGMTTETIRSRWHDKGCPGSVGDWAIKRKKKVGTVTYTGNKFARISGSKLELTYLAKLAGVHYNLLYSRWARAGFPKKIDDSLFFDVKNTGKPIYDRRVKKVDPITDRSPGWLERKIFPDAGKNGFFRTDKSQ